MNYRYINYYRYNNYACARKIGGGPQVPTGEISQKIRGVHTN